MIKYQITFSKFPDLDTCIYTILVLNWFIEKQDTNQLIQWLLTQVINYSLHWVGWVLVFNNSIIHNQLILIRNLIVNWICGTALAHKNYMFLCGVLREEGLSLACVISYSHLLSHSPFSSLNAFLTLSFFLVIEDINSKGNSLTFELNKRYWNKIFLRSLSRLCPES